MNSWDTKGRPAIFKALTAICDEIGADLAADVLERDQRYNASANELERLRAEAAKAAKLESENRALKEQVASLSADVKILEARNDGHLNHQVSSRFLAARPEQRGGDASTDAATNDDDDTVFFWKIAQQQAEDFDELEEREATLSKNVAQLNSACGKLKAALDKSIAVAKQRKEDINNWAKYADSLEIKIGKLKKRIKPTAVNTSHTRIENGSRVHDRVELTPEDAQGDTPSRPSLPPSPALEADVESASKAQGATSEPTTRPLPLSDRIAPRRALSVIPQDTFQEGLEELVGMLPILSHTIIADKDPLIKDEPSSDGPVVLSERQVKKRKLADPEPDLPTRSTRRLKLEENSSDPVITRELPHFNPQESMDLDECRVDVETPRKRRFLHPAEFASVGRPRNNLITLEQPHTPGFQGMEMRGPISAPPLARSGVAEMDRFSTALTPISANRLRRKAQGSSSEKDDSVSKRHRVKDKKDNRKPSKALALLQESETPHREQAQRLTAMLNMPFKPTETILKRPTHRSNDVASSVNAVDGSRSSTLALGCDKHKVANDTPRARAQLQAVTPASGLLRSIETELSSTRRISRTNPKDQADQTPLRKRPLSSLKMGDFKINAKNNKGETHAFTEVVRDQSEREGLAGCIDPQCCGKYFRAMAVSERKAAGPALITQAESVKLLEDYLGDDAHRLGSMARQEKEELWLEAKTRELANKYGKHRHQYHRRPSPPGFWNPDFPSTQEEEQNREEAERIERKLIAERYREAMRKNGRWLFRDE